MIKSILDSVRCYIALGSNMGDSNAYLQQALDALSSHPLINQLQISHFYKSKPHGPKDQPDYLNAAACFNTQLSPENLLDVMQGIETDNDRVREGVVRWGARTLDLDLIFYGIETIDTPRLTVPHPRICERAFVLLPLQDLLLDAGDSLDDLKINKSTSLQDCINALPQEELDNISKLL